MLYLHASVRVRTAVRCVCASGITHSHGKLDHYSPSPILLLSLSLSDILRAYYETLRTRTSTSGHVAACRHDKNTREFRQRSYARTIVARFLLMFNPANERWERTRARFPNGNSVSRYGKVAITRHRMR